MGMVVVLPAGFPECICGEGGGEEVRTACSNEILSVAVTLSLCN